MNDNHSKEEHFSTEQELLRAAEGLFVEKGYSKTSINDILEVTNISKGGFYHYFSSKEDLLTAVVDQQMRLVAEVVKKIVDNQELSALDKFKQYVFQGLSMTEPVTKLYSDLFFNLKDPVVQQEIFKRARSYILPLFVKIVEQGIEEGTMKTENPWETVELLTLIKQGFSNLPEETIRDKEKTIKYLVATCDIMEKSLGIESGFLDREFHSLFKEKMELIHQHS